MAQVLVLVNPLDPSQRRRRRMPNNASVLQWVEQHEPGPGLVQRSVFVNGRRCADESYRARPDDEVLVTFTPGAQIGPLILQAVVAFVVGYVLNTLFVPKRPNAGTIPAASQVYGIAPPKNAARLGQPIPVVYGSVVCLPDFAAQPYTFFRDNEQYLHAVLCVGVGEHDVTEMLFAGTSGIPIGPDVVQWRAYQPADHGSRFGTIQGQTGVRENVVTSPAVGTQEMLGKLEGGLYVASTWYWALSNVRTSTGTSGTVLVNASTPEAKMALLPAAPAIGTQIPCTIAFDGTLYTLGTYTATAYSPAQVLPVGALVPAPTYSTAAAEKWVGPFECCKAGQTGTSIELDFVFPQGLYGTSSGNIADASVVLHMVWDKIDDAGNVIAGAGGDVQITLGPRATTTPQRMTITQAVPSGRYRVKCAQLTNGNFNNFNFASRFIWAGLKFQLDPPPASTVVYGNVTLISVSLKASNGVAEDAASSMRFRVKRRLAPLGSGATAATANPADAFVDILTAPYGGARPVTADELDLADLSASRTAWAGLNGFNGVFDQPSTVWEALGLAVQTVHAAPLPVGSRMSLIHDQVQPVRSQLFTDANVAAGSLQVNTDFDKTGTPAGIRVNWRDPVTFGAVALLQPPGAPDYTTIDLFGCTDGTVAQQFANLAQAKQQKQRTTIQFESELEGLNILPGDRIGVQAGMVKWAQAARVASVSGSTLTLDRTLTWPTSGTCAVQLRDPTGAPVSVVGVTQGASANVVVLPTAPPFPITGTNDRQEATALSFGVQNAEVTDWTVTTITPNGTTVTVTAINYDPSIYAGTAEFTRSGLPFMDAEEVAA